jgi:arylsulfatase A-like enzyme
MDVSMGLAGSPASNSDRKESPMPETRPNVLFLVVDDLRPQLGCYGRAQMRTPHIDGLADRGVLFRRAYCQVPVCGATRASLLTGVRPLRDRFVDYATWADHDLPGARTLPQHFREHGYVTHSCGKVFHHLPDAAERSWSQAPWAVPAYRGSWRNYLLPENLARDVSNSDRGPAYERVDVPDNAYRDGQIADHAVGQLGRLAEGREPFFLAVGFVKPHLPFNAPSRYWDLYRPGDVHQADNPFAPEGAPDEALHNFGELRSYFDVPAEGPVPEEMARELVHGYYAATSYADAQVGRVLAELDRLGLRESTIVILWGDHGWQLGEHGLWCKHCNFNTSLNAPLIVSAPDLAGGRQTDGLVEFVDVYPSLCELAGLPLPEHLEGTSFAPLMGDPRRAWKPAVFSRYVAGDSVRTDRYLYTEWTDAQGQVAARMLYDHQTDPDENVNLAGRNDLAETVRELSATLHAGWREVRV